MHLLMVAAEALKGSRESPFLGMTDNGERNVGMKKETVAIRQIVERSSALKPFIDISQYRDLPMSKIYECNELQMLLE